VLVCLLAIAHLTMPLPCACVSACHRPSHDASPLCLCVCLPSPLSLRVVMQRLKAADERLASLEMELKYAKSEADTRALLKSPAKGSVGMALRTGVAWD
jgi:hypothetical protein